MFRKLGVAVTMKNFQQYRCENISFSCFVQGDLISMREQLKNYQIAVSRITNILGNDTAAMDHLSRCLFTVGIGTHDYINNYYLPQLYPTNSEYTPVQYATVLINQYFQQLKVS